MFHGCDPATVVVPPAPPAPEPADLGVVKTVSHDIVKPGDTLTWTVVGTNYGPATSTGFVLADQLPAGIQFVSASASPELTCTTPPVGSSGSVTCTAPSVPAAPAAGSSLTLTIVATVPPTTADGSLLSNVATVSGDQDEPVPDPHPNRDETLTRVLVPDQPIPPTTPTPLPPDPDGPPQPPVLPVHPPKVPGGPADTLLKLSKTGSPANASLGATITYALRVSNIGEALAMKVRVCDTPPSGLTVVSAPGFKRSGSSVCTTISKLAIGKSKNAACHRPGHDEQRRTARQPRDGQQPKRAKQANAGRHDHSRSAPAGSRLARRHYPLRRSISVHSRRRSCSLSAPHGNRCVGRRARSNQNDPEI